MFYFKDLVVFPRRTYSDGEYVFDMAYITPQIIVASMPSTLLWELPFCNDARRLREFLNKHHRDHWRILCLQEKHEIEYDDVVFNYQLEHVYVPDHTPVLLKTLLDITSNVKPYLERDEKNVILIHCKAGKGRSGMVACALLQIMQHICFDAANEIYTAKRVRMSIHPGVSIPSQQRYLRYIDQLQAEEGGLMSTEFLEGQLNIKFIIVHNPRFTDMTVTASDAKQNNTCAPITTWNIETKPTGNGSIQIFIPTKPAGPMHVDVRVDFKRRVKFRGLSLPYSEATLFFNAFAESLNQASLIDNNLSSTSESTCARKTCAAHLCKSNKNVLSNCSPGHLPLFQALFTWDQLDGAAGTYIKGAPAFDKIEIVWENYQK